MPNTYPRRAALATFFGGVAGLLSAAPALAWHGRKCPCYQENLGS